MKILKHIFNTVVWVVLGLYLLLIFTFSIPAVQRYTGRRAAGILASELGTSVTIERLQVRLPAHITLYNVNIKDQQGTNMLTARRLSARLDLLPLYEGRISIATAQVFGTHVTLYRNDSLSAPNYQFVVDALASRDTTASTPLDLRINSLIMRHSSVRYDRKDAAETPGILNPNHLAVSDISAHIILKALRDDSLNVNIKRLSLKEQSGLNISRLSMKYDGGRHASRLSDFVLHLPNTELRLGDIRATYRFRGNHFVTPSLNYSGSIAPSTVTLADIACLLPDLQTFNSTLSLAATFSGRSDHIDVPSLKVSSTTGDIGIDAEGHVGRLQSKNPQWAVNINDLMLSGKSVDFISRNLKGQRVEIPAVLQHMGSIHARAVASGTGDSELNVNGQLNTDAGNMLLKVGIDPQHRFKGDIDTRHIDLGRLLGDSHFGTLATKIVLEGQLPTEGTKLDILADGVVEQFEYNGYQYRNISINGRYNPQQIAGKVAIDDPNIALHIEGMMERQRQRNTLRVDAGVQHFAPQAIGLTDYWGETRFAGDVKADISGSGTGNAVGTIDISNLGMDGPQGTYNLKALHIESGYNDSRHFVRMDSDFGEMEITGDFDLQTLPQSITNLMAKHLPTLPGLPKQQTATMNNFAINGHLRDTEFLRQIGRIPLTIAEPVQMHGMVNDTHSQIAFECNMPQFYYDGSRYDKGHVGIISSLNTLQYDAGIVKFMDNGEQYDLHLLGSAHNNQLTNSLTWDNHAKERMSGKLVTNMSFDTTYDGKQNIYVTIAPSQMKVRNTDWDIQQSYITYRDKYLEIKDFGISHDAQFLQLNGTASESASDSITVRMRDVDIQYVLDLVGFDAVTFDGKATGGGILRGVFGTLEAEGSLTVRDFLFEHGRMGTLRADVAWNRAEEQIDIHAVSDDGSDAMTYIDGLVSPKRNVIDLDIRAEGTHLDFAQSFTDSFMDSVTGHAQGAVRLAGPLDAINITGQIVLNGNAHVRTTGCAYELRNDTVTLVPNEISFDRCAVYDQYGNKGILTGGIHHKDLTNLTYDIFVDADNLLAYDFKSFGDNSFYGTVYATGAIAIHGIDERVDIEAHVTPQKNSLFVYNAASPEAVNDNEFIRWGSNTGGETVAQQEKLEAATEEKDDSEFRSDLYIRLHINATPDATLQLLMDARTADYITLHGHGALQASYYNKGSFTMNGTYQITDGTYGLTVQNIIRKNFTFREGGTIVFGGDPYDATLNLQAQHTVNGVSLSDLNVGRSFSNTVRVNCLMNITGQPRAPILNFDIDMPNVSTDEKQMVRSVINGDEEMNQQVLYLLAVGRFFPQGANNANQNESGPSKTSLAMQSLLSGTLSGQLNNMLGNVIKSKNWNFGANISTGDEGWNNAEYEGLISGRLFNNRLLVNGQFGYRDNARTATTSFIGDFDIRYLLFPNGNLALKVYNQTSDRYFTRSSLNTQGLGLIMKKDFDGLSDFFGIKKRRKKPTHTEATDTVATAGSRRAHDKDAAVQKRDKDAAVQHAHEGRERPEP